MRRNLKEDYEKRMSNHDVSKDINLLKNNEFTSKAHIAGPNSRNVGIGSVKTFGNAGQAQGIFGGQMNYKFSQYNDMIPKNL